MIDLKEIYRQYAYLRRLAFPEMSRKNVNNWRVRHPEKAKESDRTSQSKRRKNDPESHRRRVSKWQKENRDWVNAYSRKRYSENLDHRIKHTLRNYIGTSLRRQRVKKTDKTMDILGCSIEDFKIYIESLFEPGMTWENYGKNGWEIDHIVPCSIFDFTNPDHRKRCFHFSNLQPLWFEENRRKGQILSNFLKD